MSEWKRGRLDAATFDQLARERSGSELWSSLLEVLRVRASARTPADVLAQYQRDRFVMPAAVDQRVSVAIDAELLDAAADFTALELSPVAPLGTCSTIAPTDQHRVLSALRATEVVSDPTNVLALECAKRLRHAPGPFHFVTSQRVIRAQPVPKLPGYAPHFRIFVLGSGGIETVAHGFTVETLERHVRTLLRVLDRLEERDYTFGARRLVVLATPERAPIADRIATELAGAVEVAREPLEHPYYSGGLRYMLWVTAPDGKQVPLGDGGTFDWLAKLASNRRAVYVASGMGAQIIPMVFRRR